MAIIAALASPIAHENDNVLAHILTVQYSTATVLRQSNLGSLQLRSEPFKKSLTSVIEKIIIDG